MSNNDAPERNSKAAYESSLVPRSEEDWRQYWKTVPWLSNTTAGTGLFLLNPHADYVHYDKRFPRKVDKEITLDFEWAGPVDRLPEVAFEAARAQLRRLHAERHAKGVASTLVLTPPAWE
jgi:hypothetical protein